MAFKRSRVQIPSAPPVRSAKSPFIKVVKMKTYAFRVVIEPDDDRWNASCPVLEKYGASTWGNTKEEALKHIQEVVQMIVDELIEERFALVKQGL